ncbi:dienelactone hydrolase family protein [Trichophaea hybrida]|nr:dienelactone hydrolase family protein [Trichophaea hybrida]
MYGKTRTECCGIGHLHSGTPKGSLTTFASINTYITGTRCNKVILFLTDVIGHKFINAQLLADSYAAHGYQVVMPDLFNGDPWILNPPEGASLQAWITNHQPEQTQPIVDAVMNSIKTELKPEKICAVGYCFGAKYELAAIKGPLSIAAAETDTIFTRENRHQSEAKLAEIGATYQINLFSGVSHGFSVRGDITDPQQKWAKERAFEQALEWFKFHLSG